MEQATGGEEQTSSFETRKRPGSVVREALPVRKPLPCGALLLPRHLPSDAACATSVPATILLCAEGGSFLDGLLVGVGDAFFTAAEAGRVLG